MTEEKDILSFEELVKLITSHAQIALDHPYIFNRPIKNVAVIGAGPHGLCSARHLKEAGMNVKIFERNGYLGGLWKYSDTAPPKPKIPTSRVTLDESSLNEVPTDGSKYQRTFEITPELSFALLKKCPPSACYRDLVTNIPAAVFAFPDFPMPKETPVFPKHQDMLSYFESYAEAFGLLPLIELNTSVDRVMKIDDEWELVLSKYDIYPSGFVRETRWRERFDAVVAASGLHQDPYVPDIKDLTAYNKMWPTKVAHSKQFRRPEDFKDKSVLIVGVGISGVDIARSLDGFAKSIVMAYKGSFTSPFQVLNIIRSKIPKDTVIKPDVVSFSNVNGEVDGTITFQDGTFIKDVDHIFFCTGYTNSLGYLDGLIIRENEYQSTSQPPFADVPKSKVVLGREYALNTYHEVFLMSDPTLCFIAMARIFSLTPYYDTQAIAIARVWSGNACVPETRWMCQLEAEFNPGLSPKLNVCDIRRREVYVSWLNYQAKKMGKSDLPQVKNFDDDYEQEGESRPQIWCDFTDAHLQKTKERIQKELESLLP